MFSPAIRRLLIGLTLLLCGYLAFDALAAPPVDTSIRPSIAVVLPAESLPTCVTAIAAQSDPAKLATLGKREANPRLKRILYYLAEARASGADPGKVID